MLIRKDFMLFRFSEITLFDAKWYASQGWFVEIFDHHVLFSKG